ITKVDTHTVAYIEQQFKALGLQPGNGDSYFQEVPLVEIASEPKNKVLTFKSATGSLSAQHLDEYVIGSRRLQDQIDVAESELLSVRFGIVGAEVGWDVYACHDVQMKSVVGMVSDPGLYDNNLFKADTMTYYGRWKYKDEEAARQGATGDLLIHETEAASYG